MRGPATPRDYWESQAATYDRMMDRIERFIFGDGRAWVCSRATGRTLEVAIGTGRNLELFPPDLELSGIDLSPAMLAIARRRAESLGRSVDLREGDAESLPFPDDTFDSVVCTLGLCAVPDVDTAVAEMRRVLRPGGRLLLLDHVRPTSTPLRWLLRSVEAASRRLQPNSGERFLRRPADHLPQHGFRIDEGEMRAGAIERLAAVRVDSPAPVA